MNKKLADFFCDPKTAAKNVAVFLLMIFIVVYAGFQILPSFAGKIETESALAVSIFDTNKTTGYIFRQEHVLEGGGSMGIPVTFIKDGERVSRGQHFANVYSADDYALLQKNIDEIDAKIEVLQKSAIEANTYITDISKTDQQVSDSLGEVYSAISKGILSELPNVQNNLLVNMNKRNMIVNMNESYTDELNKLKAQRNTLQSKITEVSTRLIADTSGYYYGDTDGYEQIFDPSLLDTLTLESFAQLTESQPDNSIKNNSYGKIVKSFVWYVVCEADRASVSPYEVNHYYSLNFPEFSEDDLTMELVNVIKNTSSEKALLVFRGNTAPEDFTYQRKQQVNIISDKYTGLSVPKTALRIVDGEQGVYIINGDIVRFRRVNIIFETDDYYIVSATDLKKTSIQENPEEEMISKYPYISLYDSVIVKGKNLFDGKIAG